MDIRLVRLDLSVGTEFYTPVFRLPAKAADVLEQFYSALHSPRMNISDLQSFGGTSFAEVKLVISNTFSGKGKVEIFPNGMMMHLFDVVKEEEDLQPVRNYLQTCEKTLAESLPDVDIHRRAFRVNTWVDCEGGIEAANAYLAKRGHAAFGFLSEKYAYDKPEFTLGFTLNNERNGVKRGLTVQRSAISVGDLFVLYEATYTRAETLEPLDDQFDRTRADYVELMRDAGLESAKA